MKSALVFARVLDALYIELSNDIWIRSFWFRFKWSSVSSSWGIAKVVLIQFNGISFLTIGLIIYNGLWNLRLISNFCRWLEFRASFVMIVAKASLFLELHFVKSLRFVTLTAEVDFPFMVIPSIDALFFGFLVFVAQTTRSFVFQIIFPLCSTTFAASNLSFTLWWNTNLSVLDLLIGCLFDLLHTIFEAFFLRFYLKL